MFHNALMLAGIGGAVVPLVLHLLSRARHREVEWGAMMFLRDESNRQHSSARLRQWTLLLTRMAIVGLLAVALARPVVSAAGWGAGGGGGGGRAATVIVLDCSASMTYDADAAGRSRFDRARDAVLQILAAQRPGDRVALIPAGDPSWRRAALDSTDDTQAVAARLADLRPTSAAADLAESLNAALAVLEREPSDTTATHLYVVTDAQASNWRAVDVDFARAWRARVRQVRNGIRFRVVQVGEGSENVAVDTFAMSGSPAVKGVPTEFELAVRNHGVIARAGVPLVVRDVTAAPNSPDLFRTTLDVGPGATATIRFSATFDGPGPRTLAATLGRTAGPTFDDRFSLAIDVVDALRVLVVSGDERPEAFRGESSFLRAALTPFQTAGRPGTDIAVVEVKSSDAWGEADLAGRQVVVLANVAEVAPLQARALEQFVSAGGGLLIAPGSLSRPDAYNQTLHRQGTGIMPVPLATPIAGGGPQATVLATADMAHPVFRFLQGRTEALPPEPVTRFFPIDTAAPSQLPNSPRVLASYRSGEPFLIESPFGRGRVLLTTTALDADWSRLPLTKFYLPFAQSLVRHLASAALPERNVEPGAEARLIVSLSGDGGGQWVVRSPDGRSATARVVDIGGGQEEIRFAETDRPGTYTARSKSGGQAREVQFIVRPPRHESDLTPLGEQRWSGLTDSLDLQRVPATPEALASENAGPLAGRELWPTLLAAVIALAAVELLLARLWSAEP